MQKGQVFKRNNAWHLRFYRDEFIGGQRVRKRSCVRLAPVSDEYRRPKDCALLARPYLDSVNRSAGLPEGSLSFSEFTERYFLPYVASKRTASTARFYKVTFTLYLRDRIGHVRLRDFTTRHAQEVLDAVALSHQSLLRIKTTMSAVFSYAARLGFVVGANPIREAKAEGTRNNPQRYAYTLDEIQFILGKLSEPARTACAVAAFAGLRESEIRGLQWPDYTGEFLHVRRSLWRTHVGQTKTAESANAVPVIAPLRKLLDQHKRRNGHSAWIFAGEKKGFSLNLDNLCRRDIRPVLGKRWHGWHAFRRGLATNLFELGVPAEVAQTILRHANVSTTRQHYIVLESRRAGRSAMRKLEKAVSDWARNGQHAKRRKSRSTA
jgi:integrase